MFDNPHCRVLPSAARGDAVAAGALKLQGTGMFAGVAAYGSLRIAMLPRMLMIPRHTTMPHVIVFRFEDHLDIGVGTGLIWQSSGDHLREHVQRQRFGNTATLPCVPADVLGSDCQGSVFLKPVRLTGRVIC